MHKFDLFGQHLLDTVTEDGMRVSPADFHDLQRPLPADVDVFDQAIDFRLQAAGFFGITEFVDVFHGKGYLSSPPRSSASRVCTRSHRMW